MAELSVGQCDECHAAEFLDGASAYSQKPLANKDADGLATRHDLLTVIIGDDLVTAIPRRRNLSNAERGRPDRSNR